MFDISSELLPLFLSFIFLSLVVLWVAITNRKNALALFVIIPLTFTANAVSYFTIDGLLGYSIQKEIAEGSMYIHHIESFDGDMIHVWVIEPYATEPRAILIENTEENREQMRKAAEQTQNGVGQQIRPSEGESNGNGTNGGEYEVYDFVDSTSFSKD